MGYFENILVQTLNSNSRGQVNSKPSIRTPETVAKNIQAGHAGELPTHSRGGASEQWVGNTLLGMKRGDRRRPGEIITLAMSDPLKAVMHKPTMASETPKDIAMRFIP